MSHFPGPGPKRRKFKLKPHISTDIPKEPEISDDSEPEQLQRDTVIPGICVIQHCSLVYVCLLMICTKKNLNTEVRALNAVIIRLKGMMMSASIHKLCLR